MAKMAKKNKLSGKNMVKVPLFITNQLTQQIPHSYSCSFPALTLTLPLAPAQNSFLLPLDRCRRFRADIINNPVYAFYPVYNPV